MKSEAPADSPLGSVNCPAIIDCSVFLTPDCSNGGAPVSTVGNVSKDVCNVSTDLTY